MTAFDSNRQKTSSVTSYHIGLVSLIRQAQGSSLEIHANPGNKAQKLLKILLFDRDLDSISRSYNFIKLRSTLLLVGFLATRV